MLCANSLLSLYMSFRYQGERMLACKTNVTSRPSLTSEPSSPLVEFLPRVERRRCFPGERRTGSLPEGEKTVLRNCQEKCQHLLCAAYRMAQKTYTSLDQPRLAPHTINKL